MSAAGVAQGGWGFGISAAYFWPFAGINTGCGTGEDRAAQGRLKAGSAKPVALPVFRRLQLRRG